MRQRTGPHCAISLVVILTRQPLRPNFANRRAVPVLAAAALLALGACSTAAPAQVPAATPPLPPAGAQFDYQLGGTYPPPEGVTVVGRDSTEQPEPGLYSICYINGFQTQPGVDWPDELLLHDADGAPLIDPGWPDEVILDTSTEAKRAAIVERHRTTIEACARAGFAAVEFDNLDSYTRSDGSLSEDDAVALAADLVAASHEFKLAAAQKNSLEFGERGRDEAGYDFAITEECDLFDECGGYAEVFGEHVLNIEYTDDLRDDIDSLCARNSRPASTIVRDRSLSTPASPEYVYRAC